MLMHTNTNATDPWRCLFFLENSIPYVKVRLPRAYVLGPTSVGRALSTQTHRRDATDPTNTPTNTCTRPIYLSTNSAFT